MAYSSEEAELPAALAVSKNPEMFSQELWVAGFNLYHTWFCIDPERKTVLYANNSKDAVLDWIKLQHKDTSAWPFESRGFQYLVYITPPKVFVIGTYKGLKGWIPGEIDPGPSGFSEMIDQWARRQRMLLDGPQELANLVAESTLRVALRGDRYVALMRSRNWTKSALIERTEKLGTVVEGENKEDYALAIVATELDVMALAKKLKSYGIDPSNLPD